MSEPIKPAYESIIEPDLAIVETLIGLRRRASTIAEAHTRQMGVGYAIDGTGQLAEIIEALITALLSIK